MLDILVVTPTLGDRKSIIRTVSSVKTIGKGRVKHIIIAPQKKVEYLSEQFPEIEVISEPANCKGIYSALNFAIKKYAHAYKYVTYLNDDDYWLPDYNKLIGIISEDKTLDFVYGKIVFVDEKGDFLKRQACSTQFKSFLSLLQSNIVLFTQQATLLSSALYFEIGGFSEEFKLISDSKMWIDLSLLPIKYKYIDRECAAYMIQDTQLSANKDLQSAEHAKLLNLYPKTPILKVMLDKVLFRILNISVYLKRF